MPMCEAAATFIRPHPQALESSYTRQLLMWQAVPPLLAEVQDARRIKLNNTDGKLST
jgi:hypothetical protein